MLSEEVLNRAKRPDSSPGYVPPEGLFAEGIFKEPAALLAALGLATADNFSLFPLRRIPKPPKPSGRGRRSQRRWSSAWHLWSLANEICKILDYCDRPGSNLEEDVAMADREEEMPEPRRTEAAYLAMMPEQSDETRPVGRP